MHDWFGKRSFEVDEAVTMSEEKVRKRYGARWQRVTGERESNRLKMEESWDIRWEVTPERTKHRSIRLPFWLRFDGGTLAKRGHVRESSNFLFVEERTRRPLLNKKFYSLTLEEEDTLTRGGIMIKFQALCDFLRISLKHCLHKRYRVRIWNIIIV